jgi:hypothetical protein
MRNLLKYTGLVECKILQKTNQKNHNQNQGSNHFDDNHETRTSPKKNAPNEKKYIINKSEIKKRLYAVLETKTFKKFTAFWTITFPIQITEQQRYTILNTFLTRARKQGLKHYIWVAEKHKNGTIHFHIITNFFCDVKVLNGYIKSSCKTIAKKENLYEELALIEKYNGFDISKKRSDNKRQIAKYVTKYITKNNQEFNRLCWYTSKSLSNVITSVEITDQEKIEILGENLSKNNKPYEFENDFMKFTSIKESILIKHLKKTTDMNEEILKHFEQ